MKTPHAMRCLLLPLLLATGLAVAQPLPPPPPAPAPLANPAPPAPPAPPAGPGKVYAPGEFDRLELAGVARVVLAQGERDQAYVAGDADAQRSVEVELVDRQLVIRPSGGWKFWQAGRLFVRVEMRELRQLTVSGASEVHAPRPLHADRLSLSISGAGTVRLDQLQAKQLVFDISGGGDARLAGRVDELSLQISGKGKVLADGLQAARARVSISGLGDVLLWVTDDLSARISGIGTVAYYGQPQVQRSVAGMGTISAKGDKH